MLDQWPFPSESGARVHDKLMLRCLTQDWNAVSLCWEESDSKKSVGLRPAHLLQHRRLGWRNIMPAVLGMFIQGRPLHHAEFLSGESQVRLSQVISGVNPDVIVLSSTDLACAVPFLRRICGARIIVDTHDIQVQRCESILDSLQFPNLGQMLKYWLLIRSYSIIEKRIFRAVDSAWVLKDEDRSTLLSYGSCRDIHIVPNVVDPDSVSVLLDETSPIPETPAAFVYVGKYDYEPNEQCALMLMDWFSDGPLSASKAQLNLVGVAPTRAMTRKASGVTNIRITGPVTSLDEFLKPIDRIFIAPILAGGGVKRKVIEAMAMGCPVITTDVGAEGLDLRSGETAEVCTIDEFPQRALDLMTQRARRRRLAIAGQKHILAKFGFERLRTSVQSAMERFAG